MPTSSLYYKQPIVILDDSASTSQTSASLVLYGGLSAIENSSVYGVLSIQNSTQSTSFNNGSLVVDGGVGIAKNLNVQQELNVTGDSVFVAAVSAGSIYLSSVGNLKLPISNESAGSDGFIRYNDENDRFEGYVTNTWMPLGGVIDTDQDTKIIAELNEDDDHLRFIVTNDEYLYINTSGSYFTSNGSLYYDTVNITPNYSDIVAEKSFTWTNATAITIGNTDITGLQFDNDSVRGFNSLICVDAVGEEDQYTNYEVKGIQRGSTGSWYINSSFVGDNTGLVFNISAGQLNFSSPTNEFSSIKIKFKAQTTSIPE